MIFDFFSSPVYLPFRNVPLTQNLHPSSATGFLPFPFPCTSKSQTLSQPIPQLRLPKLRQIIHALLTQINALQLRYILCWRLANSLHNDRRVCFEDDAIVYYFVDGERD
jgi:hypothetical protein